MKKFTQDPVKVLLTKLTWLYNVYKDNGEEFKGKNEYEVLREIISVVERNNNAKRKDKTVLKLIKGIDNAK